MRRERKRGVRRGPYKRRSSSTILLDSLQERRRSQSVPPSSRSRPESMDNPIFRALSAFEKSEMYPPHTPSPFHSPSPVTMSLGHSMQSPFTSESGNVENSPHFSDMLPNGRDSSFYSASTFPRYSGNGNAES